MDAVKEEIVRGALRRAFNLGQVYWQQSDHELPSQWKKANETKMLFESLVELTIQEMNDPLIDYNLRTHTDSRGIG